MLFNPSGHHWKNIAIKYILLYKNGDIRRLFKSAPYSSEQIKLVQMLYLLSIFELYGPKTFTNYTIKPNVKLP